MSQTSTAGTEWAPARSGPVRDLAQLGVCAFLVVLGVIMLVDATGLGDNTTGTDPLGPKAVPVFLGSALILLAVGLTVAVLRGSKPELEGGEDVDLEARMDLKTVLMLIGVFVANIVLIDVLGWVISGAILFYGSAIALGSRHYLRALVIAVALSLITFYGFAIGLGVGLPAGILQGIL
ncbi:tripartite tricarboxylate transporter TctB family protein [Microlunatus aurantiacus]|uniref:Tripartite tricarboxylate transporter TctB family protein n=1 Tax=Microlunatus aurantiacus TaxID=446786 RepID=A0ABP7DW63_9ACTN